MNRVHAIVLAMCAAGMLALVFVACGDKPPEDAPKAPTPPVAPAKPVYVRPKLSDTALTESMYYPLDTCVVTGKKLVPHSHYEDIGGRLVRTYNQHSIDEVKKDPEKFFAMIDAAYKAKQAASYPLTICAATGEPLPEKPVELVMDLRHDYALKLFYIQQKMQQDITYRYSIAGRLLRFKDEAALAAFKSVEPSGRMPVAELAMDRYSLAMIEKHRRSYPSNICAVNKKTTGRPEVDPETGGYRYLLLGDQFFVLCCKTCLVDAAYKFDIMVDAAAWLEGKVQNREIKPEERNILILKKLPAPPE